MTTEPKEAERLREEIKAAEAGDRGEPAIVELSLHDARALLRALSAEPVEPVAYRVEQRSTGQHIHTYGAHVWEDFREDWESDTRVVIRPLVYGDTPQPAPLGFSEWRKRAEELVRDFAYAVESNALGESDDDTPEELAADEVAARAALSAHLDAHPSGRKVEQEAIDLAARVVAIRDQIDRRGWQYSESSDFYRDIREAGAVADTLLAPVLTDADGEEETR